MIYILFNMHLSCFIFFKQEKTKLDFLRSLNYSPQFNMPDSVGIFD